MKKIYSLFNPTCPNIHKNTCSNFSICRQPSRITSQLSSPNLAIGCFFSSWQWPFFTLIWNIPYPKHAVPFPRKAKIKLFRNCWASDFMLHYLLSQRINDCHELNTTIWFSAPDLLFAKIMIRLLAQMWDLLEQKYPILDGCRITFGITDVDELTRRAFFFESALPADSVSESMWPRILHDLTYLSNIMC